MVLPRTGTPFFKLQSALFLNSVQL